MLNLFEKFLGDDEAADMYITGIAGTGKTTSLADLVSHCMSDNIKCVTTAYTHKACSVLRGKLPKGAPIRTLHSFLSKRPTINDKATKITHVEGNTSSGNIDHVRVLFIDEFSMVGERDFVDISDLQYNEDGEIRTKVVYIGDPNQLPPVKDVKAIIPQGMYWHKLTKVYRQENDNPLIDTLYTLNDYINGEEPRPLTEHDTFERNVNIIDLYKQDNKIKIILAFTNAKVQDLNADIQGRIYPDKRDIVYTPTLRQSYTMMGMYSESDSILTIDKKLIELNSQYKTLEAIHKIDGVNFYTLIDEKGNEEPRAAVFGHAKFLAIQQSLANKAVFINKQISTQFNCDAKEWAKENWSDPLAKSRGKAWAAYLNFKSCVLCLDFAHAMTVHKSQGSTYENVYIDIQDLGRCADKDYTMYLKLLYVAVSRASNKVFTN